MTKTWINNQNVEDKIYDILNKTELEIGKEFETTPSTHEEQITGSFTKELIKNFETIETILDTWARKKFRKKTEVHCKHEKVAAIGPEKKWGADIGFYLNIKIDGKIHSERGFLVQAKKAELNKKRAQTSWKIDQLQLFTILKRSPFSTYFFYGLHSTKTNIKVMPAELVFDVVKVKNRKSIPYSCVNSFSRNFSDFFLYDFIGNWWGDKDPCLLNIVKGSNDRFPVKDIFKIEIHVSNDHNSTENDYELCNR